MSFNQLKRLVTMQKAGQSVGIYSACSANEYVIRAVLQRGKEQNSPVLIESTANQCNQYGGYTGMTPLDFRNFVHGFAKEVKFDMTKLFLGGDHLGPLTWSHLPEAEAMQESEMLIRQYVKAGFCKIHIDTSMRLQDDDPNLPLSDVTIARRAARLAKIANEEYQNLLLESPDATEPVYIVGSEVPIPGGATDNTDGLQITTPDALRNTVQTFSKTFFDTGVKDVWENVIAVVVQPGVEERDSGCVEYDREKARDLMRAIEAFPNLVFEGHSTDYQTKDKLSELVNDGVAILKVGPGLTFAMREALFALSKIEEELFYQEDFEPSNFMTVLEKEMQRDPKYWRTHYHGNALELRTKRLYSFSDRARYYMPYPAVESAKTKLIHNLKKTGIPLHLLSQYMPIQYTKVRSGILTPDPEALILDRIVNTIDEYLYATNQGLLCG